MVIRLFVGGESEKPATLTLWFPTGTNERQEASFGGPIAAKTGLQTQFWVARVRE
jgi:hypothetical protein